ncbi:MAG TPA: fused MFS/spermidine synthase [Stellaceae bacterium]|nr:fused MFS/spermidine synthase [Stellaceae bacterium]
MSSLADADNAGDVGEAAAGNSLAVAVVFFVSGMPALVYQLIWQRSLFTMYGINVEAVTVVVAGFLLGLGFGSLAGGRLSRMSSVNLLALFGIIETIIGAFGASSLRIIDFVGHKTLHLPIVPLTMVTLLLLFVPTLFMGSTLPILTAYLVRRSRNVGRSVGLLYCVNTVGSATACLVSALFLMHVAGMQGCVTIAAAMNVSVGAAALGEAWRTRGTTRRWLVPGPVASTGESRRGVSSTFLFAIILAALVGYVSLSYEIVWFRAFSIASNTTTAFALILGAYLAGIANGSLRVRRSFGPSFTQGQAFHMVSVALLAASVMGFLLLPAAAYGATTALGYFFPMLLMVFAQTTVSGMIFPIICHYAVAPDDRAGSRVSWVYVANILGSVAGTLVTGFILMNYLTIAVTSEFLGVLGIGIALLVALTGGLSRKRRRLVVALGTSAIGAILLMTGPVFTGFYENLLSNNLVAETRKFLETVENRSGVITVDSELYVYGNGIYDGRIAIDLMDDENLLIRPFALSLYPPNPENVLLISLATGAWEQVIASHPSVKHATIIEINPGYLQIIKKYPVVASLLNNPKVEIIIDDGRRWLNRHPERKFDAIIQNTTWYYRPNATNLLSQEYLKLTAAHLREGGIIMYNTTGSQRVQRTGCMTFPSGYREINMLVVSPTPIKPDQQRLRDTLVAYRINGRPVFDLADPKGRARLDEVVNSLTPPPAGEPRPGAIIEDCGGILARTAGMTPITDDNMGEEWSGLLVTDPLLKRLHQLTVP